MYFYVKKPRFTFSCSWTLGFIKFLFGVGVFCLNQCSVIKLVMALLVCMTDTQVGKSNSQKKRTAHGMSIKIHYSHSPKEPGRDWQHGVPEA